jgi:hypothetical protein
MDNKLQSIEIIRQSSLSQHAEILGESLLPSARIIVLGDDEKPEPFHSHFGGQPSLPCDISWPEWDSRDFVIGQITRLEARFKANPRATGLRDIAERMRQDMANGPEPLPFLGQISLREITAIVPLHGWPTDGTLLFFAETSAWGFDPLARGHCRVFYASPHVELAEVPIPRGLPDNAIYPCRGLTFSREWTLPTRMTIGSDDFSMWGDNDYADLCRRLMPTLSESEPIHRCGGHPQEIQGEMRLECQLVAHGIYCGDSSGYEDPRRKILERGAADWQLLIQIDSDEARLGWMWGDSGRVYFWARQQDIEMHNFDDSWSILQCY